MIDTHCHVYPSTFGDDVDATLQRARDAGVERMVIIGAGGSLELCQAAVDLAERHEDVFATAGFHPHEASAWTEANGLALTEICRHPRVVAVGEMGLDYHYDYSPRDQQEAAFRAQIAIAREVGKPIVIHNRESDEDCIRILREEDPSDVGGVVHCFTSSWELAECALEHGLHIGFTGIVSFRSAEAVRDVLRRVPRDRIVIETDSPYLAPVPFRGRKNEPAYVKHVGEAVARALDTTLDDVLAFTTENARRLYRIDGA